jgi:hypothetical protein
MAVISSHHLLEEEFCRYYITFRAQHELNDAAFFIHSAMRILLLISESSLCIQ